MKNRLFILGILSLLLVSCSKETAEIPGITGEYIGTYKYINESAHSNNEFLHIYSSSNWPSAEAKVTVSIESDNTMKIIIRSSLRNAKITGEYKVTNGTYNCQGVEISNGYIYYSKLEYGVNSGNDAGGWVRGEYLYAFQ